MYDLNADRALNGVLGFEHGGIPRPYQMRYERSSDDRVPAEGNVGTDLQITFHQCRQSSATWLA